MRVPAVILFIVMGFIAILGGFPWGVLHDPVAERLSERLERAVTIESVKRRGVWSLTPTLAIRGVQIPQADWAGEGQLAEIETLNVRFAALPVLTGKVKVLAVEIDGMSLNLVRHEDGRKSWEGEKKEDDKKTAKSGGSKTSLRTLVIRNSTVAYDDAKRNRRAEGAIASDETGFVIEGEGFIHEEPVRIRARGAPVSSKAFGKPWPFRAEVTGEAVGMVFDGEMERPFSFGEFRAAATAHGDNLALVDAIIEAGLPETQPVELAADVTRAAPDWIIRNLTGTIGRSDIAGEAVIKKGERTYIEGRLASKAFDFDALSSDEGKRKAAAKKARIGERIFPDTAIDLTAVDTTDGRLEVSVEKLLWSGPSPFQSMNGVIEVDRQLLTIRPLEVGLKTGVMTGEVVIDQSDGKDEPVLDFTLQTDDARFMDFFPGAGIDGSMKGHIKLKGTGDTVRKAIGASAGSVAIVARDGVIPANTASLLGQDVGRGLTADGDKRAQLRCIVTRLDVEDGTAVAEPAVIDTSRALTKAQGHIDFEDESMALSLYGVPKIDSVVRLEGAIPVAGTIKSPDIGKPEKGDSIGEILESIGEAIIGDEDPKAQDANCDALAEEALR